MLFLSLLAVILSTICTVSGELDGQCNESCNCCMKKECHEQYGFKNTCTKGCIDGHRGARCYELCRYQNCKVCGGTGQSKDCTECYDGFYLGPKRDCASQCPSNCKTCSSSRKCTVCKEGFYDKGGSTVCPYAICPTNCNCNYRGDCLSCKTGYYGTSSSCTNKCPVNCLTCELENVCNECKNGFYNMPKDINSVNLQLNICSSKCRDTCTRCQSQDKCSECIHGKYGNACQKNCSVGCKDGTCFIDSGQCECAINFTGDQCMKCVDRKYGAFCNKACSKYCKGNTCKRESGHCKDCMNEYLTGDTCETCLLGKFGEYCEETCSGNCPNKKCERYSGYCSEPCTGNFNGSFCDKCKRGKHGEKCNMDCPINCAGGICLKNSGTCEKCAGNFYGNTCDQCNAGYYNTQCNEKCSQFCYNNTCHRNTGGCTFGCKSGYSGDKCCVNTNNCVKCFNNTSCIKCESGYYKELCNNICPEGCLGSCNISTGDCEHCQGKRFGQFCNLSCSDSCKFEEGVDNRACAKSDGRCYGCHDGFFGHTCNSTCSSSCVDRECRQDDGVCIKGCEGVQKLPECILSEGQSGETTNLAGAVPGGVVALVVVVAGISLTFFFCRRRRTQKGSRSESAIPLSSDRSGAVKDGPVYANINKKRTREADFEDAVVDETNEEELDDGTGYYNCDTVNKNVKVANLFSYVTENHPDIFGNEFKNLPKPGDLSALCKVAKRPENISLNRYNGIYPFDHSRVTIPGEAKFFINACYIDGHHRSKAYIASLGPTFKHTDDFTTFWKMVWHEKSDIIVMLTNLREASGMKCDQYWPEVDTEICYGEIKVTCRSVEEFAEYTVRCFTVSKGKEHRQLTQLHFTAWPDKGVPSEVASLVEFRQRVKAAPVFLDGPVIVHCSAGVGRTGTYIALDILSEQGKAEGLVNVFNCVSEMRGQRVNMVQTAEQYIFLYKALVYTLTFGCESQTAEDIQSLAFDADSTFLKIFQTLKQVVDCEGEQDIAGREENRRKHPDKSRRHSDIPGHRGRVRLYLHRKCGSHDFINAVFIDSFKVKDLFIAAQTPQTNTVEDFLCMIYQQNSYCVVTFGDQQQLSKKHDIGIFLPADNQIYKCGAFTVTSLTCENKAQYTLRKLTVKHTDKGEEKIAYHFQYTEWGNGRKIADNPGDFVQFVKDVKKYLKQRDLPNLVVHCFQRITLPKSFKERLREKWSVLCCVHIAGEAGSRETSQCGECYKKSQGAKEIVDNISGAAEVLLPMYISIFGIIQYIHKLLNCSFPNGKQQSRKK